MQFTQKHIHTDKMTRVHNMSLWIAIKLRFVQLPNLWRLIFNIRPLRVFALSLFGYVINF